MGRNGNSVHLPVIDVDGGVSVPGERHGRKAILTASHQGEYRLRSNLFDLFGDYGIDLEVHQAQGLRAGGMMHNEPTIAGPFVRGIVLRAKRENTFVGVPSSTPNHSHLYMQQEFREADNTELMQELLTMGIISHNWLDIFKAEGMGVVRAPWSRKPENAFNS